MNERITATVAALFLAGCLVACGGGSAPAGPELTRITISGMPGAPLAPMQTEQLTAAATYSDGAVKDVTGAVAWDSTNDKVMTVSPAGLVTATGPGTADVSAALGGVAGTASAQVVALPAAYFSDGVEYAFAYELDAQGRVDSYRITQRQGVTYPALASGDPNVMGCSASLSDDYGCSRGAGRMSGSHGRLARIWTTVFPQSTTYSYDPQQRLTEVYAETQWTNHVFSTVSSTLGYDASGHLAQVSSRSSYVEPGGCSATQSSSRITLDSRFRLSREEGSPQPVPPPCRGALGRPWTTQWTYSAAGFLELALQPVVDELGAVTGRRTTRYAVDPDGWLLARVQRVDTGDDITSEITDTYAIVRVGGKIAEEEFTQAEPSGFYGGRRPQRIRYEWGRLPAEPLFVPRALTGLNGADYFGIISSHHR
jgi:hypothetical protein